MRPRTPVLRWAIRGGAVATAAILAGAAGLAVAQGAAGPRLAGRAIQAADPYSPAAGHSYRHGVLPTIGRQKLMLRWLSQRVASAKANSAKANSAKANSAKANSAKARLSPLDVSYGGGIHGHAVTTGPERVYLIFWGSQWGIQSVNGQGDVTLANDPSGEAPYLQELFKGLGTGGEKWSGVMTQYCDGVKYNAKSCPASAAHVAYPAGGALAGVWVDGGAAAPGTATGNQLGAVAIAAAHHFGHLTTKSNAAAQFVIVSPTGTHPDGFNTPAGEFCAWHDDTADPNLPSGPVSSTLDVAFTNLPYVTDLGLSCGENFVNAGQAGLADGISIVEGHEYAETITDQLPAFGWTNALTGAEAADLCAWSPPDTAGGTDNLTLPTGTFAMQSIWSNDDKGGRCQFSHPVITNG